MQKHQPVPEELSPSPKHTHRLCYIICKLHCCFKSTSIHIDGFVLMLLALVFHQQQQLSLFSTRAWCVCFSVSGGRGGPAADRHQTESCSLQGGSEWLKGRHGLLAAGLPSLPTPPIISLPVMAEHAASSPHFCFTKAQDDFLSSTAESVLSNQTVKSDRKRSFLSESRSAFLRIFFFNVYP